METQLLLHQRAWACLFLCQQGTLCANPLHSYFICAAFPKPHMCIHFHLYEYTHACAVSLFLIHTHSTQAHVFTGLGQG